MTKTKLATFKIQGDRWDAFIARAAEHDTSASALLKLFIDGYLDGRIDTQLMQTAQLMQGIDGHIDKRLESIHRELEDLRGKVSAIGCQATPIEQGLNPVVVVKDIPATERQQSLTREDVRAWRKRFEAVPTTNLKTPEAAEAWLKECLKLNAAEDMYGDQLAVTADAVIEAVKEDDRLSPENMRQMQLNAMKRINGL